jgi:large subunit ribosomal protein L4
MPRKMRRAALRSALTAKVVSGDILFLDNFEIDSPRTKILADTVGQLTHGVSTLLILADSDDILERSARNIPDLKTLRANYLNIRDLLGYQKILMPLAALEVIQGALALEDGESLVVEFVEVEDIADEEE